MASYVRRYMCFWLAHAPIISCTILPREKSSRIGFLLFNGFPVGMHVLFHLRTLLSLSPLSRPLSLALAVSYIRGIIDGRLGTLKEVHVCMCVCMYTAKLSLDIHDGSLGL